MNYQEKYLKYKKKYLDYKYGGYIKNDIKIEGKLDEATLLSLLDHNMPLCSFDRNKTESFVLINQENYILINNRLSDDYNIYQLDNMFNINRIEKPHIMIEDNIIISGINNTIHGIHLIQAYNYHNQNIFRIFFSRVWTTGYIYFNKLKDIIYKKFRDMIVYQNNINIVLSIIFMNKLDYILFLLDNLNIIIKHDNTNYYEYRKSKKIPYEIKTGILFDYINAFDYLMIKSLDIDSFDKLRDSLIGTLSNIYSLNFSDNIDEFNIIMKIIRIIYNIVSTDPTMIEQYNYLLFINKYKDFNAHSNDTTYKSLKTFINDYNFNIIKNKLVLKLSCLIYLCYKTNIEIGDNYKISQYMLLDYFLGITKINNFCVPINKRQVLLKILDIHDTIKLQNTPITDELEIQLYERLNMKFKEIKQYTTLIPITYTDCGETTILNIFNYLLLKEDGSFNLEDSASWDERLRDFYNKYPTMDSMVITTSTFKKDLVSVFNNRPNFIYNKKEHQCDINTDFCNIISICCVLLNIKTVNFKDIFQKLNKDVRDEDVVENWSTLKYSDKFRVILNDGHGEFMLNHNIIKVPDIEDKDDLFKHWIIIDTDDNRILFDYRVLMDPIKALTSLPTKYSLDHFKYYIWKYPRFFEILPKELQTEELCIEALNPTKIMSADEKHIRQLMDVFTIKKIVNKTYNIWKALILMDNDAIDMAPPEIQERILTYIRHQ